MLGQQILRKLSYVPIVRKAVIAIGLRSVAQRVYERRFAPADGVLRLAYGGCEGQFATPSIRELRALELFAKGDDEEFRHVLRMVHEDEVFFDIGAQYGVYSYLIGNSLGASVRVVAFEPFPRDFALLQRNTELNKSANVLCVNAALSDFDGEVSMSSSDDAGEICPRIGEKTVGSQSVAAARGDALIAAGKVPFPNVIKLDVEGHELAVIRGMAETLGDPRCHSIYCEIHDSMLPPGDDPETLIAFLRDKGFNSIKEIPGINHCLFAEKVPTPPRLIN
jgi:FkbM family methyltransferase